MEYLLLGLGNPQGYEGTRHNVGKDIVKGIVSMLGVQWRTVKGGVIAAAPLSGGVVICAVSDGFMNETGADLRELLSGRDPSTVVVMHDEVDFAPGVIKLSHKKRLGTHRGVASVAEVLASDVFPRVRIGVGRGETLKRHVLEVFPEEEVVTIANAVTAELPAIFSQLLSVRSGE